MKPREIFLNVSTRCFANCMITADTITPTNSPHVVATAIFCSNCHFTQGTHTGALSAARSQSKLKLLNGGGTVKFISYIRFRFILGRCDGI